jgi:pSer/pThr/pTyr-binding forkhead associated (FHA) protein
VSDLEQDLEPAAEPPEAEAAETEDESSGDGPPPASGPRLVLKRQGQETEDAFLFSPPAVIGRFDPSVGPIDVDLGSVPEGSYVSRKHARIDEADGVWTITDLGSSNGTYVLRDDFEKVDTAEISDGTEIALGNARFVFRTD